MTRRTKKVGASGRYGPRYGLRVRRRISEVDSIRSREHTCPKCFHESVKRVSSGIWECRRCNLKFAAGAYTPSIKRVIREVPSETRVPHIEESKKVENEG